jgi:hypothetical protein
MRAIWIAFLVSGCVVTQPWVKPGSSADQMQQDKRECEYESRKATAAMTNGFIAGAEMGRLERMCMEVRGYRR